MPTIHYTFLSYIQWIIAVINRWDFSIIRDTDIFNTTQRILFFRGSEIEMNDITVHLSSDVDNRICWRYIGFNFCPALDLRRIDANVLI